ncbi:MAG: TolC family protein [Gemmatimonadaceae bacterium]
MLFPRTFPRRLARACALGVLATWPAALLHAQAAPRATDTLRLSLADAVTIAMRQSDEVGLAATQVDVANGQYGQARANLLPQLRITGSYLHTYESARGQAVGQVFNQPNTYTVNGNLSQTLFQGGRLVYSARSANDLRKAAQLDEHEERAFVAVQVQRAYLQALYAGRLAELQASNLVLASNRLTQVEQFERAGQAARYDVLRARVERSNLEPLAIQAVSDRELAVLELKRLINVPVEQPLTLVSRIDPASAIALLAAIDDSTAAAQRAAVSAAELTLEARKLGVKVARADYFPLITAFFQQGYQAFPPIGFGLPTRRGALDAASCPAGSAADRLCQNGGFFSDRQAGLNFSFPAFDGFRIRSNVEVAAAQERIAAIQLQQQRETVSLEEARARAELRRARSVFAARQQNSAEADEAFRLATLRFSRGLSTQLEVSDAQLALLTAQSTEARATYDVYLAAAELARSLGRTIPLSAATTSLSSP